jgi:hypothetical protein
MLKERTNMGLARSNAQGRIGGRRFKLSPAQQKEAISMMNAGGKTQVARSNRKQPPVVVIDASQMLSEAHAQSTSCALLGP